MLLTFQSILKIKEDLTDKGLYKSLKNMEIDKSLGKVGLAKGFYKTFWN